MQLLFCSQKSTTGQKQKPLFNGFREAPEHDYSTIKIDVNDEF